MKPVNNKFFLTNPVTVRRRRDYKEIFVVNI